MSEVQKLEHHLSLLREEYLKLQNRFVETERKYEALAAAVGDNGLSENSFISRLLKKIADLFEKDLYSDITVRIDGRALRAHRFVLSARSDNWGIPNLSSADSLDLGDVSYDIGHALLKWVYTDQLDVKLDDNFVTELMKTTKRFELAALLDRCEQLLISRLDVRNSIMFYQVAENLSAESLKSKSLQLISSRWNDFTADDFACMSAPLLYRMLRSKSEFPLHTAIHLKREDIVFLYLIENDGQLLNKINERNRDGFTPLALALSMKLSSIAKTLVSHGADVNAVDLAGRTLLMSAIEEKNAYSCSFLLENGADIGRTLSRSGRTALHTLADIQGSSCTQADTLDGLLDIAKTIIDRTPTVNSPDSDGDTALHLAIRASNEPVFRLLLSRSELDVNLKNRNGDVPLWSALNAEKTDFRMSQMLIDRGHDVNVVFSDSGDSLLHRCVSSGLEDAACFLLKNKASTSVLNRKGESVLHAACAQKLKEIVVKLLAGGADPNVQTKSGKIPDQQTALHLAVGSADADLVRAFVEHNNSCRSGHLSSGIPVDFAMKDSLSDTPFSMALWEKHFEIAEMLKPFSDMNAEDAVGSPLLLRAILSGSEPVAVFLIKNGANVNIKSKNDALPLIEAIKAKSVNVVRALCERGADLSVQDSNGDPPLWVALENDDEDIASILVENGCDKEGWSAGPTGCLQTLLHRCIDANNETAACFLVNSMCDVNALKKAGAGGAGEDEAREKQTPLHMAACWGLERVADSLIEMGADVNATDVEGKTPVHVAVANQNLPILESIMKAPNINLAIKDRKGLTPFATALNIKNNKAAQIILKRDSRVAAHVDSKGHNYLHTAVKNGDLEAVLFLLSIHIDVNMHTHDSDRYAPLHLAAINGHEMITRNLLLAGAHINAQSNTKQSPLHLAAANDRAKICSIFLENGTDFHAVDSGLNNALHLAVQRGSVGCVKILLTESEIDAAAVNLKGQTPLHVLGAYGKETAASIFEVFMETMPNYNIDLPDANGNTMLLLAYMNGNFHLCKVACCVGACLGATNNNGISVFNYQTPTKQLLFRLLEQLVREPRWAEGDSCSECNSKFTITTRKHHCRHCGRLLCAKCSDRTMPIIKYDIQKPVRVCDICFDVLTFGGRSD